MRRVAIIGNGYVGQGMYALFSRAFDVCAYDPVQGRNDRAAAEAADLAVVCVPTPMASDGSCDTSIVEEVCAWLPNDLVLIKSTVPPGTTSWLNREHDTDRFHFSPEYMGEPRNYVAPWRQPDPRDAASHSWVTVGGPRASEVLDYFARVMAVDARYMAATAEEAELAKYMENAYLALKVTFCNEFERIGRQFGVDYKRLRELWLADPRMEADHTMVFPDEPGFGGKCLPKDTRAIVAASVAAGWEPTLMRAVLRANAIMRGDYERAAYAERLVSLGATPEQALGVIRRRSGG